MIARVERSLGGNGDIETRTYRRHGRRSRHAGGGNPGRASNKQRIGDAGMLMQPLVRSWPRSEIFVARWITSPKMLAGLTIVVKLPVIQPSATIRSIELPGLSGSFRTATRFGAVPNAIVTAPQTAS